MSNNKQAGPKTFVAGMILMNLIWIIALYSRGVL